MLTLFVIIGDLILINLLYVCADIYSLEPQALHCWFLWNVSYFIGVLAFPPLAHQRMIRIESIAERVFRASILMSLCFGLYLWVDNASNLHFWPAVLVTFLLFLLLFLSRYVSRAILKHIRRSGRNTRSVIFVGAGNNLAYLHQCMTQSLDAGYRFIGYFDDKASTHLPAEVQLLGNVSQVESWLSSHQRPNMLFCNLPSSRSAEIVSLINYCDRHFIHFYSVPNVRNYVHRVMEVEQIGGMPVLSIRKDPLSLTYNKLLKRSFDLVVSGIFILFFFWWIYLLVALITKITMPGPVLFKQKRNGLEGKEFLCLKFRSMKVNADADRLQATKDDPRKTKWGNIMRKTSIDELPQFINVFMGDMSIVGPRPHMVKHTEEYSALIEKYMVRHWVKPGITGWAQVRGARGETEHLWQMEDRVKKDIWYIENWSLWLDIKIMFYTVWNALGGDKQAY